MKLSDVQYASIDDVFKIEGGDEIRNYLADYLRPFAKPVLRDGATEGSGFAFGNQICLKCGEGQDGMFGRFQWGLQHGEGRCGKCGWPARMYHFLKLPDGTEGRIVILLQYHPDVVGEKKGPAPENGTDSTGKTQPEANV